MDCPNCKLTNPPTAFRCDCGYDFILKSVQQDDSLRPPTWRDVALFFSPWPVLVIAGIVIGVGEGLRWHKKRFETA